MGYGGWYKVHNLYIICDHFSLDDFVNFLNQHMRLLLSRKSVHMYLHTRVYVKRHRCMCGSTLESNTVGSRISGPQRSRTLGLPNNLCEYTNS